MAQWASIAKLFVVILALTAGLFGAARSAEAHAILVESTPAIKGMIAGPEVALSFRFNSRIDKGRSVLTLTAPGWQPKVLEIMPDGPEDTLAATVNLAPGHYNVRWQVLAIDGHITRGDVPFDVTQ